jgi:hypothetical protein
MKKLAIVLLVIVALSLSGIAASPAHADGFGIHFSGPGYHVDFGRPHRHHLHYGGWHGGGFHGWHGGHVWHDTSHYDYHPGEWVRHWDHYDYVPGHWDFHPSGHWDHYHW